MAAQRAKVYELVLFNNILVQLSWSSFGSFLLVFPSRRLSVKNKTSLPLEASSEAYSEPCQTSKIETLHK